MRAEGDARLFAATRAALRAAMDCRTGRHEEVALRWMRGLANVSMDAWPCKRINGCVALQTYQWMERGRDRQPDNWLHGWVRLQAGQVLLRDLHSKAHQKLEHRINVVFVAGAAAAAAVSGPAAAAAASSERRPQRADLAREARPVLECDVVHDLENALGPGALCAGENARM
eukprot:365404-Chlamydomonas_euryale.AAC.6